MSPTAWRGGCVCYRVAMPPPPGVRMSARRISFIRRLTPPPDVTSPPLGAFIAHVPRTIICTVCPPRFTASPRYRIHPRLMLHRLLQRLFLAHVPPVTIPQQSPVVRQQKSPPAGPKARQGGGVGEHSGHQPFGVGWITVRRCNAWRISLPASAWATRCSGCRP